MRLNLRKRLPFLGLRGKLLIAFVGLALAPLGVLALYNTRGASRALTQANAEHLRLQLASNIGHIESYLALLDANARMFARWVEESGVFEGGQLNPGGRSTVERFFYHFAWMRPDYYQIRLLDERGQEQVRVDRNGDRLEVVAAAAMQDKSDRYYFIEAMAMPVEQVYFSPVDLNVERGEVEWPHQLVFRVAFKTRDREGRMRGLVIMNVFAREILDRLRLLRPDPRGDVLFVGEQGRFVRETCAPAGCTYSFGDMQNLLAGFGEGVMKSLLAGETQVMVEGPDQFLSYAPIHIGGPGGEPRWRLAIIYPRDFVLGPVQAMRRLAYFFAALVAVAALVLSGLATRTLTRPIRRILGFVQGVAVGDFRQELVVETRDEIERLAEAVRHMAKALEQAQQRLLRWNEELHAEVSRKVAEIETLLEAKHSTERQLQHADRLASLGMLSASLAHEIGNPLASIKTVIQVHLREPNLAVSSRQALELVLSEIDRLADILERVTGYVRPMRDPPVSVTVAEVFRRVAFLLEREGRQKDVSLRLAGDATTQPMVLEAQKLEQVLLNLVVNSLQASEKPGEVTVEARLGPEGIELAVSDNGPGIPGEIRSRVFEPFVTTKPGGTGLGLPIVRQLVREMGGEVRLDCPPEGGTQVTVKLPAGRLGAARREVTP
ncbi:MAG: HAMP domain-containing protein [Myxococcales bacterium]|nr:HAMP domain-containing protein [Myxococcales bacterium]